MEPILMLLFAITAFCVVFVLAAIGNAIEGTDTGTVLGGIVGTILVIVGFVLIQEDEARRRQAFLSKEIGIRAYREISKAKGRHCDVDRAIAAAMRDGRISNRERLSIRPLVEQHDQEDARALVSDARPATTCR